MGKSWINLLGLLLVVVSLANCGGGGDSSTGTGSGASSTSSPISGVITGFGSVFINGVEYETGSAEISTDDNAGATESDLDIGMVVTIEGSIDDNGTTGTATAIHYEEQLKGPLAGTVDTANQTFSVFGQTVAYDDLTTLGTLDLTTLVDGDLLEISGFRQSDGSLYATRIEKEDSSSNYKVQGLVSSLDTSAQTFQIGALTINYASAEFKKMAESDLVNDLSVRVKGATSNYDSGTTTFTVSEVKSKKIEFDSDDEGTDGSVEGFISSFTSAEDFEVNGISVLTNAETEFNDGSEGNLALNVRVKVKGTYNSDGVLVAEKVKVHLPSNYGVESTVTAVDLGAGTVTVLGVVFEVNNQTKMEDDSSAEVRFFDLADINVGDWVKIRAFERTASEYVASRIKRDDDDGDDPEIKGVVSSVGGSNFVIMGVTISVDGSTSYSGISGIGDISVDDVLEVEMTDGLLALSVELED